MIDFVIIAFAIFIVIKQLNRLKKAPPPADPTTKECPKCQSTISIKAVRCAFCTSELETVVFRNRLDEDAKIALFRVAQEALTNIERHSGATHVAIRIYGHKRGATLRIQDDGGGFHAEQATGGLGLRNMQERIEQLDGTLRILSSGSGTVIEAEVPLTHLLRPDSANRATA